MIETHQLQKAFGQKVAVRDVTFRAENGQITGLLGPNGAGKTTTLRMLYGLVRPDAGAARIDGLDIANAADPSPIRRHLGVVPDETGLYARLTPREHLRYSGRLHGLSGRDLEKAVGGLVELFDLHEIADRRCEGFSHGERRKVALARALVHDPQNIVLDEPTNGLDVLTIRNVRRMIRRLADLGKCVVFSSHVLQEVSALCDRVVIVAQGTVIAEGSPTELQQRTGCSSLEEAFVQLIGSEEGIN